MLNMFEIKDLNNSIILSDFDGTITTFDTNDRLFDIIGNEETEKIEKQFLNGEISMETAANSQFKKIKLDEETYIDYILNNIEIQPGFMKFYENIKKHHIDFVIVSGGFSNGIEPFLKKHEISDIDIYANELIFKEDKVKVKFYDDSCGIEDFNCSCDFKPCGNCKVKFYDRYKKDYEKVIFIGDGLTDVGISEKADIIFAKDSLADYCNEEDIEFNEWEDFYDINKFFFH